MKRNIFISTLLLLSTIICSADKNKKYMFYCKSGGRSGKTVQFMLDNGFTNVYYLKDGGYAEFNAALK